ncbi:DUF4214 domain-containing protein, partial [Acidisphaera rubrifaciens]|uniref:DUF4214 domain-containing protein n=1 Tax=Acidisphaera rubrifaciens TaxID=50715 RepID=UPI0006624CAC
MDVVEPRREPSSFMPLGADEIAAEMREQVLRGPVREVAVADEPPPPASDLGALLSLHGHAFVECAYATLLHRRPEPDALAHFVAALSSGEVSKAEILCALRYSAEGRAAGVRMRGLRRRRLLHRGYRLPGIGRGLRILVGIFRLPR